MLTTASITTEASSAALLDLEDLSLRLVLTDLSDFFALLLHIDNA